MYYAFSARRSFLIAVFIAVSATLLFGGGRDAASAAGEIECKVLLANAVKAGKRPTVYYAKEWGVVHVQTSSQKCVEPIEVWKARHLKWKVIELAKGASPPAINSAGKRSGRIKKTLPDIRLPKVEQVFSPPLIPGGPLYPADCNRKLDEFWFQGGHMIKGQFYWLSDVYTIDHDGNGIVDNIGFRLKSQGLPDINIRYFAPKGKIQGSYIDKLRLVSEKVIPWICFGRISFTEPPKIEQPDKLLSRPDLARDMVAKSSPVEKAKEETKNKNEGKAKEKKKEKQPSSFMFWLLTGLGILIIGGGGGAFWFIKLRHGSDDEDESEDDDA